MIRGVLDPDSFDHLSVDDYQREIQPLASLQKLVKAFVTHDRIPDIELGMRGTKCVERDNCYYLQDPVFIIDGLQRVSAARQGLVSGQLTSDQAHLGCLVHLDTSRVWERDRFRTLNTKRSKVSPNVLLRNMKDDSASVAMMLRLCDDRSFALRRKVSWNQKMRRCELITARTFMGTAARLHSHIGPGKGSSIEHMANGLDVTMGKIGKQALRDNVKAFFDFIDGAWGIRSIAYAEGTTHIKQRFLHILAELISDHHNFWGDEKGTMLQIKAADGRKLASFPIADPQVRELSGGSSSSGDMLYTLMERHFNSGKRTGKLRPRLKTTQHDEVDTEDEEELVEEEV